MTRYDQIKIVHSLWAAFILRNAYEQHRVIMLVYFSSYVSRNFMLPSNPLASLEKFFKGTKQTNILLLIQNRLSTRLFAHRSKQDQFKRAFVPFVVF